VKYLVHLGADIHNEYNTGVNCIFNVCLSDNLNLIKYLVDQGLYVNKETYDDWIPLV